ncbi:hypothetical protein ACIRH0_41240 [Streptomyces sp. NPDC093675]|uniref:hypothetical protein n=1 Tax=Streptomyces sp. NPDC093675 TaxID=3366049 RepID=UPI003813EE4C
MLDLAETDPSLSLSWSYKALEDASAAVLRSLAVHSGQIITAAEASAPTDDGEAATQQPLARLAEASPPFETRAGHYAWNGLVRDYAVKLARGPGPPV